MQEVNEIPDDEKLSPAEEEKAQEDKVTAKIDVDVNKESTPIMTIGSTDQPAGHNTVEHTVKVLSPATAGQQTPQKVVHVEIKYPDKWKKEKFFKDGDVKRMSQETADQFVDLGIGTIVEKPA